jgi:hypothetical protein
VDEDAWYGAAVAAGGDRVLIGRPIGRNFRNIFTPAPTTS